MDYYENRETIDSASRRHYEFTLDCAKLNLHPHAFTHRPRITTLYTHIPEENKKATISNPPYNRIQVLVHQTPTSIYAASESGPSKFQWPSGKFPNILVVQFTLAYRAPANALAFGSVQITMHFLFYRTYSATTHYFVRNIPKRTIRVPSLAKKPGETFPARNIKSSTAKEKNKRENGSCTLLEILLCRNGYFCKTVSFCEGRTW